MESKMTKLSIAFIAATLALTASPAGAQSKQPTYECNIELKGVRALREEPSSIRIVGDIINHCTVALGVQLKATVRDEKGLVVDSFDFWPASVRNVEPEVPYAFAMPWRVETSWVSFELTVIDRKRWQRKGEP
jgi:hypothetical protein